MKLRLFLLGLLVAPAMALGASPFTSLHPEEAHPDPEARMHSGPHSDLVSQVQDRLRAAGFDAGPVNGDFGEKTQAALAQFQLSMNLPAGGQLDELTLAHLGVRDYPVAAGASAAPVVDLVPAATPERPDEPKSD